ncbi:predicted protein [Micromonas commoda]|uniref:Protein SDA1 n=1 Tax=Micromonas commoda (strain RCC299 / NOUM17 / CCMP2709) TaxID=296587 RepID=C1E732_MICCC|nr:predicted protein [Micromonas commoda]ACO63536.1 predicted protein [Micromonas commoda]|eukprot:XP_002502278.1 predicted protein [Micromonas commoda]
MSRCDLLSLQGKAKRDPEGYRDDVLMQLQHYNALHGLFMLKPGKDFREFADLVGFLAQVSASYKADIPSFHVGLIELLEKHYALLDPHLRRSLVSALILLRNRGSATAAELLPLFFKLFRCQDKQLRVMIFRHIVADVKGANKTRRNEALNRQVQNFLAAALKDENEAAAKKALAVITELYRRNVWSDARTVNLVADACRHPSPKILVAALKFFLGQDEAAEAAAEAGDDSDDDDDDAPKPKTGVGTAAGTSSGAKKQAKLKRQMASIRKAGRREEGNNGEARFAAMQLVNDPQAFAEHLFGRLQSGSALKFDTKMLLIQVVSRVVGLHRLHLLHLYPFLQRYVQPNQREVTRLLASAATACHELVPPDALEPLLRQLVNQFVHDRARPEVVAVGINTVREICVRCPLVMHSDLLQDLAQYKRARDKPVATAARALIALFRELAPGMLEKKDRGKGADLERTVAAFGDFKAEDRVAGAELLQKEAARLRREEREAAKAAAEAVSDGEDDGEEGGEDEDEDEDEDGEDGDEAEAEEAETNAAHSDSEEDLVEHTRVLEPEDFRRIKALREAGKLDAAMEKVGAKKAKETAAEEMRRMLRLADRSNVADRRAHDKETRVASVMAGREDRGEFGASQARKNKKSGGTSNVEKKKRKNMPLAARVQAAGRRRRGSAKFGAAKAVKDKQFKGKFRKGANN